VNGFLTVHLRVNDSATGQPTPVRLHLSSINGEYYAPFGRGREFAFGRNEDVGDHLLLDRKRFAYIDGTSEISLPTQVPLQIEISKGPHYLPIRETVTLGAGQMSLRFTIQRRESFLPENWYSGDMRCHFLSPHSAMLEAQAEGVQVINLLATQQTIPSQDGKLYPSTSHMSAFSGSKPILENGSTCVAVNTLNTHPVLGRLGLLNCHRAVFPLTFGDLDSSDDWSICDWCDQCHRKTGLTVWCDAFLSERVLLGGEALIACILGKIDALEISTSERSQPILPVWYHLLNTGCKLPLVGSSAKDSNRIALGGVRTYARLREGDSFGYSSWIEAIRSGRCFATNGPLIQLRVNDQESGSTIQIEPNQSLRILASLVSTEPIEGFEIVANGEVIGNGKDSIDMEHSLPQGGWIAARAWSRMVPELYPYIPLFTHSAPVYVQLNTQTPFYTLPAIRFIRKHIEQTRDWIEHEGRFTMPNRKEHLLQLCDQSLLVLKQLETRIP
jgi:hypothetical protein